MPENDEVRTNVYEGQPDARQAGDIKPSRFRPRYRTLSPDEVALHDDIKETARILEGMIEQLPKSRESSLAMTKLEESIMWAIKGLTA